jgi:hypothetical protein
VLDWIVSARRDAEASQVCERAEGVNEKLVVGGAVACVGKCVLVVVGCV